MPYTAITNLLIVAKLILQTTFEHDRGIPGPARRKQRPYAGCVGLALARRRRNPDRSNRLRFSSASVPIRDKPSVSAGRLA